MGRAWRLLCHPRGSYWPGRLCFSVYSYYLVINVPYCDLAVFLPFNSHRGQTFFDLLLVKWIAVLFTCLDVSELKFLEFIKVIHASWIVYNLLKVLITQLRIIHCIRPFNTLGDILIKLCQKLSLRLLFRLCDQTRVRFQQRKRLHALLVDALCDMAKVRSLRGIIFGSELGLFTTGSVSGRSLCRT
jgi:hypothetical protein